MGNLREQASAYHQMQNVMIAKSVNGQAMTDKQGNQDTNQVFKTETRIIRIYRREHRLPIIQSDSFQQRQRDIRQQCKLVKEGRPTFLGLSRKPLTVDESIETLDSLITDYELIIRFIEDQKTSYTQFFSDLVDEIKDITTEKCKKIAALEQKRTDLERRAEQDSNLKLIYRNQRDQLLKAAQLVGCASLLMLKKLELIQNALTNLTEDQEIQQQVLDEMLGHLNIYAETHRLQKEISDVHQEAADMAKVAIDFEEYVGKYLGSLQELVDDVVKVDQKLSVALEDIKSLTDILLGESEMYATGGNEEQSKQVMHWLMQSAIKQGRLTDALRDAEQQDLSTVEVDFQLLVGSNDSVMETLAKIQTRLESVSMISIGQTTPEEPPTKFNTLEQKGEENKYKIVALEEQPIPALTLPNNSVLTLPDKYQNLANLLAQKRWQEADRETARLMVGKRAGTGTIQLRLVVYDKHIYAIHCDVLCTIDDLWTQASNSHFGFRVQRQIWSRLGGTEKYDVKMARAFGDQVGWRIGQQWLSYSELSFDATAPKGHLPVVNGMCLDMGLGVLFFDHIKACL